MLVGQQLWLVQYMIQHTANGSTNPIQHTLLDPTNLSRPMSSRPENVTCTACRGPRCSWSTGLVEKGEGSATHCCLALHAACSRCNRSALGATMSARGMMSSRARERAECVERMSSAEGLRAASNGWAWVDKNKAMFYAFEDPRLILIDHLPTHPPANADYARQEAGYNLCYSKQI